ncbi:MAG TPA: hypothetical protein VMQ99_19470 [Acetobacteraceae bacterium]|nr:hypothetical protein [Acetobacteraceae bacterium]
MRGSNGFAPAARWPVTARSPSYHRIEARQNSQGRVLDVIAARRGVMTVCDVLI